MASSLYSLNGNISILFGLLPEKKRLDMVRAGIKPLVIVSIFLISLVAVYLPGCSRKDANEAIIGIVGSSTVLPIAAKAAENFIKIHPKVRIIVSPGGSGVGIKSVASGLATIGMISRDITPAERKNHPEVDFIQHVIGRDAVACAVSSEIYKAGVQVLSREQIAKIYRGEIDNWRTVGGPDKTILSIDKEVSRGTRHVFMAFILGDENAPAKGADLVSGSNNEEQTKIALSDAAIGMLSLAWMNDDVKAVGIEINGMIYTPSIENIRNGSYPISRDLSLITDGKPEDLVKDFIDFVLSDDGQKIIEESGYVPIH